MRPFAGRHQVTSTGLTHAMFLTRLHDRILRTLIGLIMAIYRHRPAATPPRR